MEFYKKTGKVALGSRLRLLTDSVTNDAAEIYKSYGIDMNPKWFPVFYVLAGGAARTVTSIAAEIGHSHPSVSKIVREMAGAGLVSEQKDEADGRRNMVELTVMGKAVNEKIQDQYTDVRAAIEEVSAEANHDLWKAIEEWEFLLEQKSFFERVKDKRKERERGKVSIVTYNDSYQLAFKSLNEEWISAYFKMEATDYKSLDNPEGYIIDKGGVILVALYENIPVGVCALIKMNDPEFDYELAKMAVSPKAQGKHIGFMLGTAILDKAKELGAQKIYLESNTILKPAIALYHKLGFKKITGRPSPYERCNIQMAVQL
ncbi:bifunctional helix-turn-helix transcriptional regulator/GNAT family N-acetyltransferase [Filimonas effusa]|uniref:GNAT family N-acetyltransferase n=1 Tax=Filimonas effusa TaxID=2508721 RepID=A0A4Q1DDV0_9BACT|nr:bifunctional helix-turn-helix transcriptional regulator/GNAT family N-acetyltransferase [Filimonas effusa]RXK87148.1 GNAT family N-acetyltransferase [Filimonas effusa]